jgi:hypothetical protein
MATKAKTSKTAAKKTAETPTTITITVTITITPGTGAGTSIGLSTGQMKSVAGGGDTDVRPR